jgi:nitroreductase
MTDANDQLLRTRRSVPVMDLAEPAPDGAALESLLTPALRVADHGALTPWRIQVLRGAAREALSAQITSAYRNETAAPDEAQAAKLAARPLQAPLLLVISSRLVHRHKVPEFEQLLSGGALCQNILLAVHAAGYAAFWFTGWSAYSPGVRRALGVGDRDEILGFIAIGTARRAPMERPRPVYADIVRDWPG